MIDIDIHADDYALTVNTSEDMLKCLEAGALDSISIVPNMSCYEECMELMYNRICRLPNLPLMSVHIDLVEGRMLSDDGNKMTFPGIKMTWGRLFIYSYIPFKRKSVKSMLKREISIQIKRVAEAIEKCKNIAADNDIPFVDQLIRIDSHQHTHMIPIVWEALTEVIEEENLKVEYIRNSREPLGVFLSSSKYRSSFLPINIVKNRILSLYSGRVSRYNRNNERRDMLLWGLIMSGKMDIERVRGLFDSVADYTEGNNKSLEILFHPGTMLTSELTAEIPTESAKEFYLSNGRGIEMNAVMQIQDVVRKRV